MQVKQTKLPKSQIELEFELTAEEFDNHSRHALEHLKRHVKVEGFRQGKAPAKLVEDRIKPEALLMEAGDHAVQHVYSDYIKESGLEVVGHPEISIVKIAKGNPFIFKAIVTILPKVELPDYKEIAKKIKGKDISVSDEEVENAVNYLQKSRAKFTLKNDVAEKGDFVEISYQNKDINAGKEVLDRFILGEGQLIKGFEEAILGMKAGQEKEFKATFPENSMQKTLAGKEGDFKVILKSVQKMELPEINDDFAKQLGGFDTLVALKGNIKEGLTSEKTDEEKQRRRGEILEKISEKAKLEMPEYVVEYEKQNMLSDLKNKIAQNLKISWEEYLASVKKTEKEILDTYQKEAEKRIRNFLVLKEIGKQETVEISEEEIDQEVSRAVKSYSKDDLVKIDINQLKEYTKGVLFNEKVFQKLENLSE